MKKIVLFFVAVCVLLSGCALFQAKQDPVIVSVKAYQVAGDAIVSAYEAAVALKADGKLSAEQIQQFNALLAQTKQVYELAGDALKLYINTEDAIQKKEALLTFQELAVQAAQLAIRVTNFVAEVSK